MLLMLVLMSTCSVGFAHEAIDAFLADPSTNPGSVAVMVVDLKTGKTVAEHNVDHPLIPASVTKAVTIASLINKCGIDYVYHTNVYTVGHISDGVLYGNLLIKASGDPTINHSTGPASAEFVAEIVCALKDKKIKTIKGNVIIDQSVFSGYDTPPSWHPGDLRQYYGTGSHGFNFEGNRQGGRSVDNPSATFLAKFKQSAADAGINIEEGEIEKSREKHLLLCHKSATMDDIMRYCMRRSDNLYAETFMRTLSMLTDGKGETADGAEYETSYWRKKHAPMDSVSLVDGSGLSRQNRMTARFLANVLLKMSHNVDYVSFFPLAGQEGTLVRFLKNTPLDSYIALKTGSMNGVQCYAGYKLDDDYAPTHVVVVLLNGFSNRAAIRKATENMLLSIFQ